MLLCVYYIIATTISASLCFESTDYTFCKETSRNYGLFTYKNEEAYMNFTHCSTNPKREAHLFLFDDFEENIFSIKLKLKSSEICSSYLIKISDYTRINLFQQNDLQLFNKSFIYNVNRVRIKFFREPEKCSVFDYKVIDKVIDCEKSSICDSTINVKEITNTTVSIDFTLDRLTIYTLKYQRKNKLFCNFDKVGRQTTHEIRSERIVLKVEPFTGYYFRLFLKTHNETSLISKNIQTKSSSRITEDERPQSISFTEKTNTVMLVFSDCDKFNGPVNFTISLYCLDKSCDNVKFSYFMDKYESSVEIYAPGVLNFKRYEPILEASRENLLIKKYPVIKSNFKIEEIEPHFNQIVEETTPSSNAAETDNHPSSSKTIILSSFLAILGIMLIVIVIYVFKKKKCNRQSEFNTAETGKLKEDTDPTEHVYTEILHSKCVSVDDFVHYLINGLENLIPAQHQIISDHISATETGINIEAGFISGYQGQRRFLTVLPPTFPDFQKFWENIWKQKVSTIVIINEHCQKYWPEPSENWAFGKVKIENQEAKNFNGYIKQTLKLTNSKAVRNVKHFWYKDWFKDFSSLENLTTFITDLIEDDDNNTVLIHCQDDFDKTSVLILSEIAIKMATKESKIDLFKILNQIKIENNILVSNAEQYILSHFIVLEYILKNKNSPVNLDENLEKNVLKILNDDKSLESMLLNLEADKSMKMYLKRKFKIADCDKINLEFSQNFYVVREQPDQSTNQIRNFCRNLLNLDINLVIILNRSGTSFWPEKSWTRQNFNEITLETLRFNQSRFFDSIELKVIAENKRKQINLIPLKCWESTSDQPDDLPSLIHVCIEVLKNNKKAVLVTCCDGVTASGLFIALCFLIEKMKKDRICDVFEIVKGLRRYNCDFVKSQVPVEFLYKAAVEYVKQFEGNGYLIPKHNLPR